MAKVFNVDSSFDYGMLAGASCAFGVFDGVHKGHCFLINQAKQTAAENGGISVALTFDIDPDEVFAADRLKKLMTNEARIAKLAELLAPLMCGIYIVAALFILFTNITRLPGVLTMIFQSAFGIHAVFGGILGSAVSWGVKRGIYSNEAGMGCGAIVSAAAECSHPAKQGLIQSFSIYVDTLFIGTSTAFIVLLTGTFDVTDGAGNLLLDQTGGIEAGIKWTQHALMGSMGSWTGKLLAIIIVLFVFTSMTGYCYQAESNVRYLTGNSKLAVGIGRAIFLSASFLGAVVDADAMWAMGDIGYGLMAWANIIAIALLAPKASALLKDYEKQKKPVFHPERFGIKDETGAWKKER